MRGLQRTREKERDRKMTGSVGREKQERDKHRVSGKRGKKRRERERGESR